jgi:hypothetical protein
MVGLLVVLVVLALVVPAEVRPSPALVPVIIVTGYVTEDVNENLW